MLTTVTGPSVEPVTLEEAKAWAKVDTADDDTLITMLIGAARESAENFTKRAFISQTLKLTLDLSSSQFANLGEGVYDLPVSALYGALPSCIELLRPPIASITSVTTYSTTNVGSVYSSSNYSLFGTRLVLNTTSYWPSDLRPATACEILYVAGYGATASEVPQAIRQAILIHVQSMYDARSVCEMPENSCRLLRQYRIYG